MSILDATYLTILFTIIGLWLTFWCIMLTKFGNPNEMEKENTTSNTFTKP